MPLLHLLYSVGLQVLGFWSFVALLFPIVAVVDAFAAAVGTFVVASLT